MTMKTKEVAERFKVLSCETRVAIIKLLKQGPKKVTEIAETLNVSQPAASQHLKLLKAAGVVTDEKDGFWVSYSLKPLQLLEIRRALEGVCRCCDEQCQDTLEAYKRELEAELEWIKGQLTALRKGRRG